MYLDDMGFIIKSYLLITRVFYKLNEWCKENDMELNMGPNKTALIH